MCVKYDAARIKYWSGLVFLSSFHCCTLQVDLLWREHEFIHSGTAPFCAFCHSHSPLFPRIPLSLARYYSVSLSRPTQSIMYVPLQVNRFQESILLIVKYKYLKSCSGDFYPPESDPPHNIMRYWLYYSI